MHSVELDPLQPDDFFMRKVDPQFPIPILAVDAVQVRLADGTPDACFSPGESIVFAISATNSGDSVTATISLYVDDDADRTGFYHRGVTIAHLASAESKHIQFALTLPEDVRLGQHNYQVDFEDEHAVLGFKRTGWQPAFVAARTCPRPEIGISPTSVSFGSQDVDSEATPSQTVTITNEGTANLSIHSVVLVGADAQAFDLVSDTGQDMLEPSATRIIQVVFDPVRAGACQAILRIQSNDGNEDPLDVVLSGSGTVALDERIYLPLIASTY
jgi:hypothetical protein